MLQMNRHSKTVSALQSDEWVLFVNESLQLFNRHVFGMLMWLNIAFIRIASHLRQS